MLKILKSILQELREIKELLYIIASNIEHIKFTNNNISFRHYGKHNFGIASDED